VAYPLWADAQLGSGLMPTIGAGLILVSSIVDMLVGASEDRERQNTHKVANYIVALVALPVGVAVLGMLPALAVFAMEPGVWDLSPKLKPMLTQLGERIDTLNIMRDALGEEAAHRSVANYMVHRDVPRQPVTGHLVGKDLAGNGLGDEAYLVIDGVDACVHYVELSTTLVPEDVRIGAILTVGRREPSARTADKTIAAYAARNDGLYEPREHYGLARMTARIPGGDVEGHIEAHVRRLEALRRAGIVVRLDADNWVIPRDFLERATAYDEREGRKHIVEVHSAFGLDRQITADAATWLDASWSVGIASRRRPWASATKSNRRSSSAGSSSSRMAWPSGATMAASSTGPTCWPRSKVESWTALESTLPASVPMAGSMSRRATVRSSGAPTAAPSPSPAASSR